MVNGEEFGLAPGSFIARDGRVFDASGTQIGQVAPLAELMRQRQQQNAAVGNPQAAQAAQQQQPQQTSPQAQHMQPPATAPQEQLQAGMANMRLQQQQQHTQGEA